MIILKVFKKIYFLFFSRIIDGKNKVYNRHKTYEDYVNKQLEKTLDPSRIKKWKGKEWQIKVDGFRHLFKEIKNFYKIKKLNMSWSKDWSRSICIKRTGFR